MSGLPVRNNDDTVLSTWIEQVAEVDDSACEGNRKRTYTNTLFSSLKVRRDNAVNIAAAGRTRWKIETETFNCLNPTYTAQLLDCYTPFGAVSTQ